MLFIVVWLHRRYACVQRRGQMQELLRAGRLCCPGYGVLIIMLSHATIASEVVFVKDVRVEI